MARGLYALKRLIISRMMVRFRSSTYLKLSIFGYRRKLINEVLICLTAISWREIE